MLFTVNENQHSTDKFFPIVAFVKFTTLGLEECAYVCAVAMAIHLLQAQVV